MEVNSKYVKDNKFHCVSVCVVGSKVEEVGGNLACWNVMESHVFCRVDDAL